MKTSREYRQLAWNGLKKDYWTPFLVVLIINLIIGALSATGIGSIAVLLIQGSANVILATFFIANSKGESPKLESIFKEPQKNFVNRMVCGLLVMLFTALWSILFIIPGIIYGYAASMTSYIQSKGDVDSREAIRLSKEMMKGEKWNLFCLQFSFIGWYLLAGLTFGIGFIFLMPYVQLAVTNFQNDVYAQYIAEHPGCVVEEKPAQVNDNPEIVVE